MKNSGRKHIILKILTAAAVIMALLLADSRFRLVTSSYEIVSHRLPETFDGFTIVQLSDVHGAEFGDGNSILLCKVESAKPDIIAVTGDLIDENTDMDVIDSLFAGLTEIAPVYFVSGNHEWGGGDIDALKTLMTKHSVTYLRNEYVLIDVGGQEIVLAGVEDPNGWKDMPTPEEVAEAISREQGDKFTVLLAHRNYWVEKYPDLPVDLILCGHAHGGIVRLPFLGGVLGTGRELFPKYVSGEYDGGRYKMIVSRGIGSSVAIPRFLNNPEIVAVTLRCA